jgi:transcriptional regulator with GAF, ATPase, and Fis domain
MSCMTAAATAPGPATPIEVVARLADGLSDHRELHHFLADIARSARGMLDIDRVTIFILEGDDLVPAVAASQSPDDELWATFREMPPVRLDVTGLAAEILAARLPTMVDARTSPLVPAAWRDTFGLSTLAITPLHAEGRVRGVLIADSADPERARFSSEQLSAIGAVASLAGLALSRFEREREASAQTRAAYDAVRAVSAAADVTSIARAAAAGLRTVSAAGRCTVAVLDDDMVVESDPPAPGDVRVDWWSAAERLCGIGRDDLATYDGSRLLGMWRGDALVAVARLHDVDEETATRSGFRMAASVIAQHTAATLAAVRGSQTTIAQLHRHVAMLTALRTIRETAPASLVEHLSELLPDVTGASLLDIVVAGRAKTQALGLRSATGPDAEQLARWRRARGAPQATTVGGRVLYPLIVDRDVVGGMALRISHLTDLDALHAVAAAVADRLGLFVVRAQLQEQASTAEAADAREQLERSARLAAARMLDSALSRIAGNSPATTRNGSVHPALAAELTQILAVAKGELSNLDEVLLRLDTGRGGLGIKLRALARSMNRPGTTVEVRTQRGAAGVEPPHAMQLLLAVREIIALAHATRAARVVIRLADRDGTVIVEVKADGRLSLATGTNGPNAYNIVRSVQRELEATGTRVDLDNDGSWFTVRFVARQRARASDLNLIELRPRVSESR